MDIAPRPQTAGGSPRLAKNLDISFWFVLTVGFGVMPFQFSSFRNTIGLHPESIFSLYASNTLAALLVIGLMIQLLRMTSDLKSRPVSLLKLSVAVAISAWASWKTEQLLGGFLGLTPADNILCCLFGAALAQFVTDGAPRKVLAIVLDSSVPSWRRGQALTGSLLFFAIVTMSVFLSVRLATMAALFALPIIGGMVAFLVARRPTEDDPVAA